MCSSYMNMDTRTLHTKIYFKIRFVRVCVCVWTHMFFIHTCGHTCFAYMNIRYRSIYVCVCVCVRTHVFYIHECGHMCFAYKNTCELSICMCVCVCGQMCSLCINVDTCVLQIRIYVNIRFVCVCVCVRTHVFYIHECGHLSFKNINIFEHSICVCVCVCGHMLHIHMHVQKSTARRIKKNIWNPLIFCWFFVPCIFLIIAKNPRHENWPQNSSMAIKIYTCIYVYIHTHTL